MQVLPVRATDLDDLVVLFDAYRRWYGKPGDLAKARAFLSERIAREESQIFIARDTRQAPAGFTQLYPSFSSVNMARVYVLNDLFIAADFRRQGVGRLLLRAARDWATSQGAIRVHLETAADNLAAQALYHDEGYVHDPGFLHYDLSLSSE